jgi:SAM-dependent methyltransferase
MAGSSVDRFDLQDGQYAFPYHYLPHFGAQGVPMRCRAMSWGFEYLCYQQHVAARVRELAPRSLLEVGSGDGRFVGMLAEIETRVGIDLSASAIRFAKAFYPAVEFHCMPTTELERQFDVVVAIEVLEHVPDTEVGGFLRDLASRTQPGGHVLLTVPTVAVPVHPKHYRHYDEALLRTQLRDSGAAMEVVSVEHVYAPPGWLDFALRYTCNTFLVFELRPLNRLIWNYIWRRARVAAAGKGRHLVATLRRSDSPTTGSPGPGTEA